MVLRYICEISRMGGLRAKAVDVLRDQILGGALKSGEMLVSLVTNVAPAV
jgi:hypothetical protein